MDLGNRIRDQRKRKKISLQEIAKKSGLSKSYIIQIENGKANPSVGSLKKITDCLTITLASIFEDLSEKNVQPGQGNAVLLVQRHQRKTMKMPGSEVEYFLLSPDLNRKIEFLLTIAKPGASSGNEFFSHEGEECGVVIKGKVEFTVGEEKFIMREGDSIYFSSSLPHRWKNVGDVPVELVWAITPPSF